jgi:YVTN family beta-propeller protein
MKNKEKFHSTALASTILILFFLISVLSVASAATAQSASPVGPFAYITGSNNVSIIDTATDTVTATVNLGRNSFGVTVTPDGKKVYVTNSGSSNVSVIDTDTNAVIETVPVGNGPHGIAVTPDGTKVYVANYGNDSVPGNVSVIDTATNTVIATVPVGKSPGGVAVSPDGAKVYVTNIDGRVLVIDTATNNVTAMMNPGRIPFGVAVTPDGAKVYVTNMLDDRVTVIDTSNNTATATVNVGNSSQGIAVTPDGTKVYVANNRDNTVSAIGTSNNTVIATVPVGTNPRGVAVNPEGTKVYVANQNSNTVSVIDTFNNTVTTIVPVGRSPVAFGKFITPKTSITVISPNGGENWRAGTSQVIRWKYTGNPGNNVKIEVLKGGRSIISFITSTGSGSSDWFIPKTQVPGNDYKVRISSTNSAYDNSSAGNFTISSPFSICNTSAISGYSFNDSNSNKTMDEGEDGLSSWTINVNGFDTCEGMLFSKTIETNSTGYFEFEDVNPGAYVISENRVNGWFPTTNEAYCLTALSNSTRIRKDFGNSKLTS